MKIEFEVDEETAEILKTVDKDKFLKASCQMLREYRLKEETLRRYRENLADTNALLSLSDEFIKSVVL